MSMLMLEGHGLRPAILHCIRLFKRCRARLRCWRMKSMGLTRNGYRSGGASPLGYTFPVRADSWTIALPSEGGGTERRTKMKPAGSRLLRAVTGPANRSSPWEAGESMMKSGHHQFVGELPRLGRGRRVAWAARRLTTSPGALIVRQFEGPMKGLGRSLR